MYVFFSNSIMQTNSLTKIPSIKSLLQLQLYQRSERTGGSSLMFIYRVLRINSALSRQNIKLMRARLTAHPTITGHFFGAYHIEGILFTFTWSSPLGAVRVLILTNSTFSSRWWIKGPHVNPLCSRPLLPFNNRTAPVQAQRICCSIRMKAEKQQSIALSGFYCIERQTPFVVRYMYSYKTKRSDYWSNCIVIFRS